MSSYYDEPTESPGPLNNRNVTIIVLAIAAVVGILGCIGLYFFVGGNRTGGNGQATQVVQVTSLPTSTASLTALPTETGAATATQEGRGGGGDSTQMPDLTLTFAALPEVRTANLDELRGLVQIKNSPDGSFQTVLSNLSIPQGTTLLTSESSSAKLTTTEHAIIRVSSQTQFTLTELTGSPTNPVTKLSLDFGKVWTIVGGPLGTGSFVVSTPIGNAEIIGSWMGVEHNSTEKIDIITCLEGKCRYSNSQGVQELKTGEELIVKAGQPLPDPKAMDPAQLADWAVTKVPEVITLTPTATGTLTPTLTRTPTPTRTPRNTPNAQQTSDTGGTKTTVAGTATALAGSNSLTQAANANNGTATANASNLTATVFFFNATATAFYNSTQNSFTATSFAFTATSFGATSRAAATAAMLTGTAQGIAATNSAATVTAVWTNAIATGVAQTQAAIPLVNFDPASYNPAVLESAGQANLTVRIANPVSHNVNLFANFTDGSATGSSSLGSGGSKDYVNTQISFFIPANSATTTIPVPIADDAFAEGNETFQVQLTCNGVCDGNPANNGGAQLGPNLTSTVTIISSGPPSVGFSTSSYSVNEGNSGTTAVTITANLSRAYANTSTVTVDYSEFAGDTATAGACGAPGVDYNTLASGALTFAPTETSKTFTITVCGDALYEPDETVNLQLTSPTNAVLGIATSALTIKNDDPIPTLSFSSPTYTITEPADPPTPAILTLPVNLSAAAGAPVTVNYATANGTARSDWGDYQATSGVLTFAPGTTTANISVSINADFIKEDPETFTVQLSSPGNAALASPLTATVTINDDPTDLAPIVNLSAPFSVPPSSTTTIVVSLNTDSGQTVSVSYSIGTGSPSPACTSNLALSGADFNAGTGLLTYSPGKPGETTKSFTLTTLSGVTPATGAKCIPITINATNATATTTVYAVWIQP